MFEFATQWICPILIRTFKFNLTFSMNQLLLENEKQSVKNYEFIQFVECSL